jgi:hypothetical protein
MARPIVIAKNVTIATITLNQLRAIILAAEQSTLTDFNTIAEVQNDLELYDFVTSGDIVINDGTSDLSISEAQNFLTAVASKQNISAVVSGGSGSLNVSGGALILPQSTAPVQTAEGSVIWDTDDDLLTIGTGSARKTMVDLDSNQTLTTKTLTSPTINGGTHTGITSLGVRSSGTGAFDLTVNNTENLTAGKSLTVKVNDVSRTVDLGGNITLGGSLTTSGANALTLTTSGATSITLPTSGTIVSSATSAGGDLSGTYPNPTVSDLTIASEVQGSILYFNGSNWVQLPPGTNGDFLKTQGVLANPTWATTASGTGDVVGPALSTDNAVARFDLATGKLLQNSVVTVSDTGQVAGIIDLQSSAALTIDSTSTIGIGTDADAQAINVGTGAAARTVTVGNITGATAVVVNAGTGLSSTNITGVGTYSLVAGTGAINLATNATDHSTLLGSVTGTSATTIRSGTGNLTITSPDVLIGTLITVPNTGLHILDTNASHDLIITPGSDLTADKTLTLTTGDSNRTLNMTGAQGSVYYVDASGNTVSLAPGVSGEFLKTQGPAANPIWTSPSSSGDVTGPAGSTDNAIARFDLATGKIIQNSVVTISDTGQIAGAIDLQASAALTIDSTSTIGIGTDADAQAINIGTGAAARTVTVGNVTGATAVVINAGTGASSTNITGVGTYSLIAGTGAINIATNATDHSTIVGGITGTSASTLQSGTGAMTFTAGGIFDVNSTGAATIDATSISIDGTSASNLSTTGAALTVSTITSGILSVTSAGALNLSSTTGDWQSSAALTIDSTSTIGIGTDADAQAINIGTGAAARTVTIGNVTGATAVVINAGTGASSANITGVGTYSLVAGTGAINLASNATDHSTVLGSITGTSATTIQSGTGNLTINSPDIRVGTILTTPNTGLHILDTNASHDLIVSPGSDLTADRTLTLTTGDSSRVLNMTGAQGSVYYVDASGNTVSLAPGTSGQFLKTQGAAANPIWDAAGGGGSGDVVGPASSTDNALARFDLATGKLLQNSGLIVNDSNDISGAGTFSLLSQSTMPAAPAPGSVLLYGRTRATRNFLDIQNSNGRDYPVQPFLGSNKVVQWLPETTTTIRTVGMPLTSVGTVSTPTLASTSLAASMKRWRMTSAGTANAASENRSSTTQIWRGNAAGLGGFTFVTRINLTTLPALARGFFGLLSVTTAVAINQVPSTLTDCLGFAWDSSQTNFYFQHGDAVAGTATRVNLGVNFPTTNTTAVYTMYIYSAPNGSEIGYRCVRDDTGDIVEGSTGVSTDIPASTVFFSPHLYMNNGGTNSACSFDCAGVYIESDF